MTLSLLYLVALVLCATSAATAQGGQSQFFPDLTSMFRNSSVVLVGTAGATERSEAHATTSTSYSATIHVFKFYKGSATNEIRVLFSRPGDERACFRSPCVTFEAGYSYLLFVRPLDPQHTLFSLEDDRIGKIRVSPPAREETSAASGEEGLIRDSLLGLEATDPLLEQQSARVLAGMHDKAAIPALRRYINRPVPAVSGAVLAALIHLGDQTQWRTAIRFAATPTTDPMSLYYGRLIRDEISNCDDPAAVPELIELTNSADITWRRVAVNALRRLRDGRSVFSLIRLLDDSDLEVAYQAVMSLAELTGRTGPWAPSLPIFMANPHTFIANWKHWWDEDGRFQYSPNPAVGAR